MTQETTPASDPRLDEWEAFIQAYDKAIAEWAAVCSSGAPDPRRNAGGRLDDARRRLADAAREAIPALIAMVRECHANINLKADFIEATINDCAALEARATAAEEKVEDLEKRISTMEKTIADNWSAHRRAVEANVRATAAEAKVVELEGELDTIVRGRYDGIEVTHYSADECRNIARAALRR